MKNRKLLVVASKNRKKLEEIKTILKDYDIEIISLMDIEGFDNIEENGTTFEENASIKAITVAKRLKCYAVADDSGLEIEALNNAPGIHSARYAGEGATDKQRIDKVLNELKDKENREARFVSVLAISDSEGNIELFRGEIYGKIIEAPRGDCGFGYDPIFVPEGYNKTFAELPPEEKNMISHRGRALRKAIKRLKDIASS